MPGFMKLIIAEESFNHRDAAWVPINVQLVLDDHRELHSAKLYSGIQGDAGATVILLIATGTKGTNSPSTTAKIL
jgi:hypothetical protein